MIILNLMHNFFQCILKKWDQIGIEGYVYIKDYALGLPYLPAERMQEGFDILRNFIIVADSEEVKSNYYNSTAI